MSAVDAGDGSSRGVEAISAWALMVLGEPSMQAITTVGLDIANSLFQVHGVDSPSQVMIRR
jgi:hypothetical protein